MNENTYEYINLDYMDMMSDGDNDMKKVMLDMLFDELPAEIAKMRALADAKDWRELMEVSHKMKSTLAFVGNPTMTQTNKDVESLTKAEEDLDRVPALVGELEGLAPKAIAELKTEYDKL